MDFAILDLVTVLPHAQAGKVKIAAVATLKRVDLLPEVPALSERLRDFDALAWNGVVAPKGTFAAVVEKLATAFQAALQNADVRKNLEARAMNVWNAGPSQFRERVQLENRTAAAIIRLYHDREAPALEA